MEIEKIVIAKDSIAAAKAENKGMTVKVAGFAWEGVQAFGSYAVTIPASQMAKMVDEVNITVHASLLKDASASSRKEAIDKIVTASKVNQKKTCLITVASNEKNGNLQGGMQVKIPVTDKTGIASGKTVYVYQYDEKTGKLSETAFCGKKVSSDGSISLDVRKGADYVVSAKKLSGSKIVTVKDSISASVSKTSAKAGSIVKVKVRLPEMVSTKPEFGKEKAVITYKSSNSRIASISKNGTVKTKKKGKVTLTVTVKLSGGQKVVKKKVITVK